MQRFFKQFVEKQLRFSPLFYKRLKVVQELERADDRSIAAWREEKLLWLVRKAYRKSPFYKSLYDKHGVDINQIKSIQDLQHCPVITGCISKCR